MLENDRAEQSYIEGKSQQQMEWLVLIVAVNKLQRMSRVVNDVREVKQKDILRYAYTKLFALICSFDLSQNNRWRSAQKIQKVYRKYIRRKAPRPPNGSLKNSPKTRAHILTQDQHHHQVYVHRQQSASLVIKFLRAASGGWKHIIFNYVK